MYYRDRTLEMRDSMKFNDLQPIYIQIMDYIKYLIIKGELKPLEKIPSVRDIASELKVNPNTVQRSYQELDREGVIFAQRGLGNFVTENPEIIDNLKNNKVDEILNIFIEEISKLGINREESIKLLNESWDKHEKSIRN